MGIIKRQVKRDPEPSNVIPFSRVQPQRIDAETGFLHRSDLELDVPIAEWLRRFEMELRDNPKAREDYLGFLSHGCDPAELLPSLWIYAGKDLIQQVLRPRVEWANRNRKSLRRRLRKLTKLKRTIGKPALAPITDVESIPRSLDNSIEATAALVGKLEIYNLKAGPLRKETFLVDLVGYVTNATGNARYEALATLLEISHLCWGKQRVDVDPNSLRRAYTRFRKKYPQVYPLPSIAGAVNQNGAEQ